MGFNDEMDFDLDEIRKLLKEKDEKPEGSADGEDGAAEAAAVERPRRQEKRAPRRVGKREVTSESSKAPKTAPAKRRTVEEEALLENQRDAKEEQEPKGYELFTVLRDVVNMLAVVTLVFVFFFRLVSVSGSSMYPTLVDKDYLVLESNFLYRNVNQGDIVVLKVDYFDKPIVKRVIATGGQTVDIDFEQGIVYVDGAALDEDYVNEPTYKSYLEYGMGLDYPVEVPEGSVFVMGDNRNESADSRFAPVGCVPESQISGRVLLIVVPGSQTDKQGNITGGRVWRRIGAVVVRWTRKSMNIQWYPGHMTKTRRIMEEDLKLVDAVCEILDARIPISQPEPGYRHDLRQQSRA